jgi:hypothetical protein
MFLQKAGIFYRLSIQSTTLSIDGTISADGGDGTTGAGSGGSIKITGDSLEGHGTISVNGGTRTSHLLHHS